MVRKTLGLAFVVAGHALLVLAAILTPLLMAVDILETRPALGIAALLIVTGAILLMFGDWITGSVRKPMFRRSQES